jgi:hypothetical protein
MKLKTIKHTALGLSLLAAVSCTNDFNAINTNPQGISDAKLLEDSGNLRVPVTKMFTNVLVQMPEWMYQVQQNLQGDIWSGYMATGTPFAGGSNNTTYNLIDGWNGFPWAISYDSEFSNYLVVKKFAKGKADDVYAMALILKVEAMHRVTDQFGPIKYSSLEAGGDGSTYDSQKEVYTKMFSELDEAVAILTTAADNGNLSIAFKNCDISTYQGKYSKWVQAANSLRLRLGMRLSKVDNVTSKAQVQKALTQKYGVLSSTGDDFGYVSQTPNALKTVSNGWGDVLMSADMESIMGGYNDARMGSYFNASTIAPGKYKGVRTGIAIGAKDDHQKFSFLGPIAASNKITFMTVAEVYFLRAEAALRGWDTGSAQTYYEAGISASFTQNGVSGAAPAYISNSSSKPMDYVDSVVPANNGAAVSTITIAWSNLASNETKLEKIITQKWIAGFPEGQEAWSERRRTGYPKLLPVLKNTSNGVIDSNLGVRRINFVANEKALNAAGVATGVAKLGGADNGATRLWWDTTGPNF